MNRRNFIKLASSFSLATALAGKPGWAQGTDPVVDPDEIVFTEQWLFTKAQNLARAPYEAPKLQLPPELANLNNQQYQAIQYKTDSTVWKNEHLAHQIQFFHTGFQYKTPVEIRIIDGGKARNFKYSTSLFDFLAPVGAPSAETQSGFSGFRAFTPLTRPDAFEEYLVFQGASYFRAIATAQNFGMSARGICINTAQTAGEEFPVFRSFWIQKPAQGDRHLMLYALLDGPSLSGVYKFRVEPGRTTAMEVECTLFPRKPLDHVGIAPLTSMYYYGYADSTRPDDYRPNVHNSDGLLVWGGNGEWIWRPLVNPERLQYTAFADRNPKGFGLMQRERDFNAYQDIDAGFGSRPGVWIEPLGDWGEGTIDLVELPTHSEIHDNIVSFWRPKSPLPETTSHYFRYRLHWNWDPPVRSTKAFVAETRVGTMGKPENRLFVIDFVNDSSCNGCNVGPFTADVHAGEGEIRNVSVRLHPITLGQRVTFEFRPKTEQTDLRCQLRQNGEAISETWVYRWSA
jgi:periplasmic glucans biosynthesis protein